MIIFADTCPIFPTIGTIFCEYLPDFPYSSLLFLGIPTLSSLLFLIIFANPYPIFLVFPIIFVNPYPIFPIIAYYFWEEIPLLNSWAQGSRRKSIIFEFLIPGIPQEINKYWIPEPRNPSGNQYFLNSWAQRSLRKSLIFEFLSPEISWTLFWNLEFEESSTFEFVFHKAWFVVQHVSKGSGHENLNHWIGRIILYKFGVWGKLHFWICLSPDPEVFSTFSRRVQAMKCWTLDRGGNHVEISSWREASLLNSFLQSLICSTPIPKFHIYGETACQLAKQIKPPPWKLLQSGSTLK